VSPVTGTVFLIYFVRYSNYEVMLTNLSEYRRHVRWTTPVFTLLTIIPLHLLSSVYSSCQFSLYPFRAVQFSSCCLALRQYLCRSRNLVARNPIVNLHLSLSRVYCIPCPGHPHCPVTSPLRSGTPFTFTVQLRTSF
jgi:hypothetical protein